MRSDSKSVLSPIEQKQGQERRQKSCLTTKDALEPVRESSNHQPVCPSRISRGSHKSVSLNAFDTPSVPAFVRSPTFGQTTLLSRLSSKILKVLNFQKYFRKYELFSMVFFNVSPNKNFLSCADSGSWFYLPKETFWLLQNTLPCPHYPKSHFQRVPPLGSCPQRNTYSCFRSKTNPSIFFLKTSNF